jgi:DNA-binding CsgD family transcriptional regulator
VSNNAQERIAEFIGHVYEAATDSALWPSLAAKLAKVIDSPSAQLSIQSPRLGEVNRLTQTANYSPVAIESHRKYYYKHDVWVAQARKLGMTKILSSMNLIADEELERSEFYQDFLKKIDVFYVVGTVFPIADGELGVLGVHRPKEVGNYDENDKIRLQTLLPHLRAALQIRRRFLNAGIQQRAALAALERVGLGTLVVDATGQIIYSNAEADSLLRVGDAIRLVGGKLAVATRAASEKLTRLIIQATKTVEQGKGLGGGTLSIPRADRMPISILVAPFQPSRSGLNLAAAILFVRDPETPTVSTLALQSLFGLTPAEAALTCALAEGKSVEDIARMNGISLNTVRTHLKNTLSKTGTSRQVELVALIFRTVATLTTK